MIQNDNVFTFVGHLEKNFPAYFNRSISTLIWFKGRKGKDRKWEAIQVRQGKELLHAAVCLSLCRTSLQGAFYFDALEWPKQGQDHHALCPRLFWLDIPSPDSDTATCTHVFMDWQGGLTFVLAQNWRNKGDFLWLSTVHSSASLLPNYVLSMKCAVTTIPCLVSAQEGRAGNNLVFLFYARKFYNCWVDSRCSINALLTSFPLGL